MKGKKLNTTKLQILFQLFFDFIAISLSFVFQYWFRFHSGLVSTPALPDFEITSVALISFLLFWYSIFFLLGMYKNWYELSPFGELSSVIKSVLIGTLIITFLVYFDSKNSPRMMFIAYFIIFSFFISAGRFFNRQIQKKLRKSKIIQSTAILIGNYADCSDFYEKTKKSPNWGLKPVSFIFTTKDESNQNNLPVKFYTDLNLLETAVSDLKPELIILLSESNNKQLLEIANKASMLNIRMKISPDLYHLVTGQTKATSLWGIPLVEISTQILTPWQAFMKRTFDIVFSFLVLILGSPLWFLIGLVVKTTSKGPIFYVQERVGKDGKIFKMFKFRSMYLKQPNINSFWTITNDPRVTPFGKFIRKTHLDEIPQFYNAFIGDMSVVGPRPEIPRLVEEFSNAIPEYKRRLKVRPGLTGWWQIKYTEYEFSLDEIRNRLKDDFYYIENFSLLLDLEIIIRTIWLMFKGHGQT
jgi:exopolysaccharide biosynthesis polyprenyl glycosylphosphotransferase